MNRILWEPSKQRQMDAQVTQFIQWVNGRYQAQFAGYDELWAWSVTELEAFWASVFEYFFGEEPGDVLPQRRMPGASWFPDAKVNFAQELFRRAPQTGPALYFENELGRQKCYTLVELRNQVAGVARALRQWGVKPGDRVVGYIPNIPEAVVALLATVSVGAIWSVCSPDFGEPSVLDRFRQIEPKVLFVVDGYTYHGRLFDKHSAAENMVRQLPSVQRVVTVRYVDQQGDWQLQHSGAIDFEDLVKKPRALTFDSVPFDHPLWILFSSGTTGLPKPIVHGHGGMLLTQLVTQMFHFDLGPTDRFFWFTTTGWMMWNVVVSGLLTGSAIILYDGSPSYPSWDRLWDLTERLGVTFFGTSAAYVHGLMKAAWSPRRSHNLSSLKTIATTGSPLHPQAFDWIYDEVKADVQLAPTSGGTDVCSSLVGGCPLKPVRRGEMQCRMLGAKVAAYDECGQAVSQSVGELVVTAPMPAMPLYFWADPGGVRYYKSYFERYPGVWTHGDWVSITESGGAVILGRSDATLNRYGVRMGSSELYRAVDTVGAVEDSLVIEFARRPGTSFMPLFVKLVPGETWSSELEVEIKQVIRQTLSPRHVPDAIVVMQDIPKTLNGKKLEVPVKRLMMGESVARVVNVDAMANPECLAEYVDYAKRWADVPG